MVYVTQYIFTGSIFNKPICINSVCWFMLLNLPILHHHCDILVN